MDYYKDCAEVIKLCGRTRGERFLTRAVNAYLERSYAGNLLELMDTLDWLAGLLQIDNQGLPADFFSRLTGCGRKCGSCGYCRELHRIHSRQKPFQLPDQR